MNWLALAFIGMFTNFLAIIFIKKLTKRIKSEIMSLYLFGILSIYFIITNIILKESYNIPKLSLIFMIIAGIAGSMVYLSLYKAISIAPNTGYPIAVFSMHVVIVTIISALVLNTSLTLIKFIGVLIAAAGIILLSLWK